MNRKFVVLITVFALSVCEDLGYFYDEPIDGPYRLVAVDEMIQMQVCYPVKHGCVERIPETVFAVGYNRLYITGAVHPLNDRDPVAGHGEDKNITQYYYIIRSLDGSPVFSKDSVRGPFDGKAYAVEQKRLSLPPLSHVLPELR